MTAIIPAVNTGPTLSLGGSRTKITKPTTIDELTIHLAQTIPNEPLVSYPAHEFGVSDFTDYTAADLDLFADEAAKELTRQGLRPVASTPVTCLRLSLKELLT